MKLRTHTFSVSLLLIIFSTAGIASTHQITSDAIKRHISVLASDSLEGREIGENGEIKAANYIAEVMRKAGLKPMGDNNTYFQEFGFLKSIDPGANNQLEINGKRLSIGSEWQPMKQSANSSFEFKEVLSVGYGITTDSGDYDDYKGLDVSGKAVLISRYSPSEEDYPHTDFQQYSSLVDKMRRAIANEAAAIFFYTPEDHDDTILAFAGGRVAQKSIPIIWLRRAGLEKIGLNVNNPGSISAKGSTDLVAIRDTGRNVVGLLSSSNDTIVIVGAHFDHLGFGGSTSRYRGKEKKIHYGADDNASGVAAMLELAMKYSSAEQSPEYSYLFVAFSGEEKGLLGSSHLADNLPVDTGMVRMMLNMDMIGRLKDQDKGLAIFGTGTCPEFKEYFDSLSIDDVTLALNESGTGPSDHTAFYNQSIPVLHFFTGAHEDYHTPKDTVGAIDFAGIVRISQIVDNVLMHFDSDNEALHFQKTKDDQQGKRRAAFSVTLGVMPDYVSEVRGLAIDGVTEDGPANRAGIIKDDILIKMGNIEIDDIYAYMSALSKFRKGDTTNVVIQRGTDTVSVVVIF